jgi:uncharacterized repeat protein (TIGR04138 family)
MSDLLREKVVEAARRDGRYHPEAYFFVLQSLQYAQEELGYGEPLEAAPETPPQSPPDPSSEASANPPERHVKGQQLCEAARRLALRQFGYLAECVFRTWGITKTADFGEIVYSMIDQELMRKTSDDSREDFENVYDLRTGLIKDFRIVLPD